MSTLSRRPFVLDDDWTIVKNPVIRSLDNFYANSTGYEFLPNRYVATLSLAINYSFGGLDVTGYHVVNLLIHLLSALLVYALLRLTFHTPYFAAQVESDSGSGLELNLNSLALIFFFSSLFPPPVRRAAVRRAPCSNPGGDLYRPADDVTGGHVLPAFLRFLCSGAFVDGTHGERNAGEW